jgi:hypothetical protein
VSESEHASLVRAARSGSVPETLHALDELLRKGGEELEEATDRAIGDAIGRLAHGDDESGRRSLDDFLSERLGSEERFRRLGYSTRDSLFWAITSERLSSRVAAKLLESLLSTSDPGDADRSNSRSCTSSREGPMRQSLTFSSTRLLGRRPQLQKPRFIKLARIAACGLRSKPPSGAATGLARFGDMNVRLPVHRPGLQARRE